MTASKSSGWVGPLTGAGMGTALAGVGLAVSHVAFYFTMPLVILALRACEKAGVRFHLSFQASVALLAVLTPLVFAGYGAAVVIPGGRSARVRVVCAIVAVNAAACIWLAA